MLAGVWYCSSVGFGLGCGRTFCRRISSSRCFTRRRKCGSGITVWPRWRRVSGPETFFRAARHAPPGCESVRPRTCFVALLLVVASLIGITSSADEEPLTMRCPSSGTPSDYACLEWRGGGGGGGGAGGGGGGGGGGRAA